MSAIDSVTTIVTTTVAVGLRPRGIAAGLNVTVYVTSGSAEAMYRLIPHRNRRIPTPDSAEPDICDSHRLKRSGKARQLGTGNTIAGIRLD